MFKFILIGLLIYIAVRGVRKYLLIRSYLRGPAKQHGNNGDKGVCNEMVKCAKCGSYVHRDGATTQNGGFVCLSHE